MNLIHSMLSFVELWPSNSKFLFQNMTNVVFRYFLPLINSYIKSEFGIYTFSKCNDKTWWMQFFVTVFCFSIRSNKIIPLFPVTRPTHCLDPPTGLNFGEFFFFTADRPIKKNCKDLWAHIGGRRSRLVKVDFAFSLVKNEVQVALKFWRVALCRYPRIFSTCHLWKCR